MNLRNIFLVFIPAIVFCCKKDDTTSTSVLSDSSKGIFGRVILYDENGVEVSSSSGIVVTFECVDSTTVDTVNGRELCPDTTAVVHADKYGRYEFINAPSGNYFIRYYCSGFNENRLYNVSHSLSKGDSLSDVMLAKTPNAKVSISKVELSSDKDVLYITKKVELTGGTLGSYGVVTHFFFGKHPYVCDTSYFLDWVSGATFGSGGYSQEVVVQKSVENLHYDDGEDSVYVVAYVDNLQYYSYQVGETEYVFPNLTSPSEVFSIKLDSLE